MTALGDKGGGGEAATGLCGSDRFPRTTPSGAGRESTPRSVASRSGVSGDPVGTAVLTARTRRGGLPPGARRRTWHTAHTESLTFGQRAADVMRNGMGSWPFIAVLVSLMLLWALINTAVLDDGSWDPYPYILLNLGLSMLAGLQGAVLLIAAKRQDGISAALALHDFETDTASKQEIDRLIQLSEQQLAIILELQADFRRYQRNEASSDQHGGQTDAGR